MANPVVHHINDLEVPVFWYDPYNGYNLAYSTDKQCFYQVNGAALQFLTQTTAYPLENVVAALMQKVEALTREVDKLSKSAPPQARKGE
jgi:hypothetical protein